MTAPSLDFPVVVAEIEKNSREIVRVALDMFKGHRVLDIRVFAPGAGGAATPTPRGITMRVTRLPALATALEKAMRRAGEAGLLDAKDP